MEIVEIFGRWMEKLSEESPEAARRLLRTGWDAQCLLYKYKADKRLMPADRYLAYLMMETMVKPLRDPASSAMVSIFTPCELLQEAGLHPYNVEGISCYLSASRAERGFLQQAENTGLSETLCSYHKTFIGAAEKGVLPRPRCIVYTSLACDANLLTFRSLAQMYDVPAFFIDIPLQQNEGNVLYVADQLRELADFLMEHTGKSIDEENLKTRLKRSRRTLDLYRQFQQERAEKYVPTDILTPLYCGMTTHILLGTEEEERYMNMCLEGIRQAPPARGKRIYWMHTLPFWSDALKEKLDWSERAQIVGCDMVQDPDVDWDPSRPYEAMAKRLVYHAFNGNVTRRIEAGIRHAREVHADGAVWFNHWGCKHTMGGAQLAREKFGAAGIPLLILDGDGCDRSRGGEGQTATRMEAFLEMLEKTGADGGIRR